MNIPDKKTVRVMKMTLNKNGRGGFSMIEVLVAATILVIIVMMLAMLFQQSSIAWRTGTRRAGAFMTVSARLGRLQRDASRAVDEKSIPLALRGGNSQSFTESSLSFFTIDGVGFMDPESGNSNPIRALTFVSYNGYASRQESVMAADGSWVPSASVTDPPSQNVGAGSFELPSGYDPATDGLPAYVAIGAGVTLKGYNLDIGAASAGPDGVWDTDDDIRTWSE